MRSYRYSLIVKVPDEGVSPEEWNNEELARAISTGVATPLPHLECEEVFITKAGTVLTSADIEALADEAERGYDVSRLTPRNKE